MPESGFKLCATHRKQGAMRTKAQARHRKGKGLCLCFGCKSRPEIGRTMCRPHLVELTKSNKALRSARAAAGMCVYCNKRPGWFGVYCVICRVDIGKRAPNSLPLAARRALKQYQRFEDILARRTVADDLIRLLDDKRAEHLLALRHGLVDGVDHTLEEIGLEMSITRERVRQLEFRALKMLEYRGHDVTLLRPPFSALQRPPNRPILTSEEQRKKNRAHRLVRDAVRQGHLIKQPCEECGTAKTVAHHRDYDKPLDVQWLCRPHHMNAHGRGKGSSLPAGSTAPKKPHYSTWLNKVNPSNTHYDAAAIVKALRRGQVHQAALSKLTGLNRSTLLNIVRGCPVPDHALLKVLRFCEQIPAI